MISRGRLRAAVVAATLALGAACSSFSADSSGGPQPPPADAGDAGDAGDADAMACAPGSCGPEVLASGQSAPFGITIDDANVYFTNKTASGSVVQCPKTGCGSTPLVLATGQTDPYGIAVDAAVVYWTSPGDAAIRGIPKGSPGTPSTLRSGGTPSALIIRAGILYWADPTGGGGVGSVESCSAASCTQSFQHVFTTQVFGVAVSEPNIYWTGGGAAGYVATCPPCTAYNTPAFVVAEGLAFQFPQGIAIDDTNLYVAARATAGVILTIPKTASPDAGVPPTSLAKDLVNPYAVQVDQNHVFFTTRGTAGSSDGTVMRVEKSGKNLTPLATQQAAPAWLAIDETYVYWTNTAGGTVMRVRKE